MMNMMMNMKNMMSMISIFGIIISGNHVIAFNGFSDMPGGFGWAEKKGFSELYGNKEHLYRFPGTPSYFREAELKHARIAMLAAIGFPIAEYWHPLFGGNNDVPSLLAFQATPLQDFWPIVFGGIGLIESASSLTKFENPLYQPYTLKKDHINGDYGFDPLNFKPNDEIGLRKMVEAELKIGRVAMLGIASMVTEELFTHSYLFKN